MKKIKSYFVNHLLVISYFIFFIMALLPTMIPAFGRLGVFYKVGVLVLFSFFLLVYGYRRKIKVNYRYLVIPAIVFLVFAFYFFTILPTYYTFNAPSYSYIADTSITIVTNFRTRLNSIVSIFNICYFATLFLIIVPAFKLKTSDFICFSILTEALTLAACLYAITQIKGAINSQAEITSFLNNKNTFGQFLMVSVFTSFLSFILVKRWYFKLAFILLNIVFFAFLFISKSSTSILLSLLFISISVILFIVGLNRIKLRFKIVIFILFASALAVVLASPVIPFLSNTKLGDLVKDLYDKVFSSGNKSFYHLFSGRGALWSIGAYIVRLKYLMFGYGSEVLEQIVYRSTVSYFSTSELTNAYLTVFDTYGIFGSIFYLAILCYLFIKYVKCKQIISDYLLVLLIVFLLYGVFESLLLFESFSGSLLLTPLLVVPAVCLNNKGIVAKKVVLHV